MKQGIYLLNEPVDMRTDVEWEGDGKHTIKTSFDKCGNELRIVNGQMIKSHNGQLKSRRW
jgi:hypothetical protein